MATIKFFIQSENNPAGIYVRFRDGVKIDAKTKTNLAINPVDWSKPKGQTKGKDETQKVINEKLLAISEKILKHYNTNKNGNDINSNWLKELLEPPKIEQTHSNFLVEYFEYYLISKQAELKPASIKKVNVIKNLLLRFEKECNHKYKIDEINEAFRIKFEKYCTKEKYKPNTTARNLKFIKTICFHAKSNGIVTHPQLDGIRKKIEEVNRISFNSNDLKLIEDVKIDSESLDNVRDWLLISCETGQRISDFLSFNKNQIKTREGVPIIEFTQVKTEKKMAVPLTTKVLEILKKRNGEFPKKISEQRYNEYIKDVCKLAGINQKISGGKMNAISKRKDNGLFEKWELVTSHIGRRTFATLNYDLIPTTLLMYVTGHTTEKSFLEYVGKESTDKALELARHYKMQNK